jgi:uncharacterized membrane protein YfcA
MQTDTLIILIIVGFIAGILGGFIGIGGGLIIVPALVFFLGMTQFQAQGTSLAMMLPPIGILAVLNYSKTDNLNWKYAAILAGAFIIGGYFGSKLSLSLSPVHVKRIFGVLMIFAALKMIFNK